MSIYERDWKSEWVADLDDVLSRAEQEELALSYSSPCRSEEARKQVGAYYTPKDAAEYFWNEFMSLNDINSSDGAQRLWTDHHFIEPASGAGILVYSLLKKVVDLGLPFECISSVEITLIDINENALNFARDEVQKIATKWGISFSGIKYVCTDFLRCTTLPVSPKKPLIFGNPPFVANPSGSNWKNSFADFLVRSLTLIGTHGQAHFILPLSVAFSRDYETLRLMLRNSGKSVALSSFDNIPDTLFSSGKPEHTNTNKANSQRCSIVTVFPAKKAKILSSRMHRWSKKDRKRLLTSQPYYYDVTDYKFDSQFPRPENHSILRFLNNAKPHPSFESLLVRDSSNTLFVSGVARNFIAFRDEHTTGVHRLCFKTKNDLYKALLVLSSDIFLEYWRTIGDGFHLTRSNIEKFPLHPQFMHLVSKNLSKGKSLWQNKDQYTKSKRHPGGVTKSYDFTGSALSFSNQF